MRDRARLGLAFLLTLACCKGNNLVKINEQTDTFVQKGANTQSETFSQKPGLIDILFVLDNQPYMCAPSTQLATSFSQFITQLNGFGLDFHIGVVTSDMQQASFQGKLVADGAGDTYLTSSMSQNQLQQHFAAIIANVGSTGSTNSQPLLAAAAALQPPLSTGANQGFLRDAAALAIIVVDDEDDYSISVSPQYAGFGFDGGVPSGPTGALGDPVVSYFDRIFKSLKGPGNDGLVSVSGIVGAAPGSQPPTAAACNVVAPVTSCKYDYGGADPAFRILQVVADTGGLGQSICQANFDTILTNLGQLLGGLTSQFAITTGATTTQVFDPSTLAVSVTPPNGTAQPVTQSATDGWSYNPTAQTVQFNGAAIPAPGSTIQISFGTLNASFKLTYPPQLTTLVVTVTAGGMTTPVQPAASDPVKGYQYDMATQSIVFPPTNLPPLGATITVEYST